ncbi:MAG: hypothetical protein NT069_06910 [Planctomycetota bacterium]|nr:hypothetical protein [Planctomycetota bacterium]
MTEADSPQASTTRTKFAWLGDSSAGLGLVAALIESQRGELSAAAECEAAASELLRIAPRTRLEQSWSGLLAHSDFTWALISGGSDAVLEGGRQLARNGVRLLVDVESSEASHLFTELTLLEAEGPGSLTPAFRMRHLPAVARLGAMLVAGELGSLKQVQFGRTGADDGRVLDVAQLDRDFVNDIDLLRGLFGRFEQITAFRHTDGTGQVTLATTTLGGAGQPPIVWSVTPGERASWRLTVQGERVTAVIEYNQETCRLLVDGVAISTQSRDDADRDSRWKLVAGFVGGPNGESHGAVDSPLTPGAERPARAVWDDLLRVVELQAAAGQSLRRRRTVDVLFEAPSERGLFKSQMTAAGCSLLLSTPVAMVLYLMLAAAVPMPNWIKVILVALVFAPVGLFLVTQALLFITRPAAGESK